MKKTIIYSLILGTLLLPSLTMAQTTFATTDDLASLKTTLIALITQEIQSLQAQLDAMLATQDQQTTQIAQVQGAPLQTITESVNTQAPENTEVVPSIPSCAVGGVLASCLRVSPSVVQADATTTFTITDAARTFPTGSGNTGDESCVNDVCVGWTSGHERHGETLSVAPDGSSLTYTVFVPEAPDAYRSGDSIQFSVAGIGDVFAVVQ